MNKSSNHQINQSPNPQILISGIGAISAAGNDVAANFANMTAGIRTPSPHPTLFDCEIRKPVFECDSDVLDDRYLPYQRTLALAMKALDEALDDANLTGKHLRNSRVGVCLGTTVACTLNNLSFYSEVRADKNPDITPLKRYINGDISKEISARLALSGPVVSIANACSSGTNAIAVAYSWIQSGLCDIVIAGGADELNLIPYCGFNSLQVMSDEFCLPFDNRRKGLNLGEGAGILIMESENSAQSRGVDSGTVLASCGGASDAFHLTGPHPGGEGLLSSIKQALDSAGIIPEDIDYINAHGTATHDNDKTESLVFGKLSGKNDILFSSTKYYTGHTLGAAGAIEAAICVKGVREGYFPGHPDIEKDPELPSSPHIGTIPYNGNAVLSTSMAFGGSCSTLIFRKYRTSESVTKCTTEDGYTTEEENECTTGDGYTTEIKISGMGIIGPFGRGADKFQKALQHSESISNCKFKSIPDDAIIDPELKRSLRRADKLSLAMLCAAKDAITSSGISAESLKTTAVVAATGLGAHNTTFKFLDGILDFGQSAPSPTHFSNSVHNAPSFYITSLLKITGLSVTMTGFNKPFSEALNYSKALIESGEYKCVLLVAGDEVGESMLKMSEMWYESQDKPQPVWGEGAVAFLLEKGTSGSFDIPSPANPRIIKVFGKTLVNDAFELAANLIGP